MRACEVAFVLGESACWIERTVLVHLGKASKSTEQIFARMEKHTRPMVEGTSEIWR